ncbi:GNAT family N-acetyltransferase [Clostridium aestuarii]|uniref:GNAT family N-acetyltransferase n=1 Tax=Clostridium aestuarii TaxID=338193 RepID=A0ABT4D2U5_9CLOT|nr:GNAT family N-acetyltransferase [Clostridium aestuarii]MCY6485551.1 GNAT family N-acetyltransferase [Clostridium aestuarii]
MQKINLINKYKIKSVSIENHKSIEKLCKECSDYYILHNGKIPSKEDTDEICTALPPNKSYEDKFVLGIYKFDNELVGIVDIVKDFPTIGEWMLGLMLIKPEERGNRLGKIVHEALVGWAIDLGATSFRIGAIEDNYKGINFWTTLGYTKVKEVNMDFTEKSHIVNVMTLKVQ